MPEPALTSFGSFDVSLVRGENGIYWLSADCTEGALKAVPVRAPDWSAALPSGRAPLDWLNATIRTATGQAEQGAQIGQALHDVLFGNAEVRQLFADFRAAARVRKQQVVLRLMGAPADVSDWPWELMRDPADTGKPLVLSEDVHVVRTPRVRTYPLSRQPVEPPINLLVIMSNPLPGEDQAEHQLDQFDLYEEKRHLLRDLAPLIETGKLNVTVEDRPTLDRLASALRRNPRGFHVVHYLGHASENGLWFEDRIGAGQLVLSDEFGKFLRMSPDLRFVLFAGCETARAPKPLTPDDWEGGLSIAQRAVRDSAPVVMGMQVVLPFRTQRLFTRAFYEGLVSGYTVARALFLARTQVRDSQKDRVELLDWAIPALFLGGADPDAVLDTKVPAQPPRQKPPVRLRRRLSHSDPRFVARHANLRRVIDVLSGRTDTRLICIRGEKVRPQDLSSLMDRAMEELDPRIGQLTFSAHHLGDQPEAELLEFLREILRQHNDGTDQMAGVPASLLRTVLVDQVAQIPLAIAIDHADELPEASPVVAIIRDITGARGKARVALLHREEHNPFNFGLDGLWEPTVVIQMRWSEVWAWLRGQLPELARLGEAELQPLHTVLGDHLERWEALADHLTASYTGPSDPEIAALAARLAPKDQTENTVDDFFSVPPAADMAASPPPASGQNPKMAVGAPAPQPAGAAARPPMSSFAQPTANEPDAPARGPAQGQRDPITVAVAGPFTEGRDLAFRDALARFADTHGLPGRVSATPDGTAAIVARALDIASPFADGQSSTTAQILSWISTVSRSGANILVLDFGTDHNDRVLHEFVRGAVASGIVVVAAGGNEGVPTWPAWDAGVLGVGASAKGSTAPYSIYFPDADKPDLFAPETLDDTPLEGWLDRRGMRGTTFAALYAAAVATLVWASYPTLSADDVRALLRAGATGTGPRFIDVRRSLYEVRSLVIHDILQGGEMELYQLVSESGLPMDLAMQTIRQMQADGRLVRRDAEHGAMFSHPDRIARRYDRLRHAAPGNQRTRDQERLLDEAKALARRRALTDRDAWGLWRSGQLGNRIVALAHQYKAAGDHTLEIIEQGILGSMTAFEQYHALRLAQIWSDSFEDADRNRIVRAITTELSGNKFDDERRALAQSIIAQIAKLSPP